jgi:regulator of protease activity HflC (stomatin/prohibitin superfamily)
MYKFRFVLALVVLSLLISGCYLPGTVDSSEVGLKITSGKVEDVLEPGRYTDVGWYTSLATVDTSAKTTDWKDPDLVTRDKQPIGLTISVTYARNRDHKSIKQMWTQYNTEARDDKALAAQVLKRVPGAAKDLTTRYSLDEMLGITPDAPGRAIVTQALFDALEPELEEIGISLLNVTIGNIAPSEQYLNLLEEKANAQASTEVAREMTKQLEEQLKQEEAQTQIELEKARRQNEVNSELAKTYEQSPEYFELEKLRLMQGVIGGKDKLIFIPPGTDLSLLFSADGLVPLQ